MNTDYNMLSNYPDVLRPTDLMEILHVGKNTIYKLLKSNMVQSIKIGKNYKIPKSFVVQYLFNV